MGTQCMYMYRNAAITKTQKIYTPTAVCKMVHFVEDIRVVQLFPQVPFISAAAAAATAIPAAVAAVR